MTTPYAPQWLAPSTPGQMTNKRGSNTGADSLALKVKFAGRGTAPGSIRIRATKPGIGGGIATTALDSWWLGEGALNASLNAVSDIRANSVFQYDAGSGLRGYYCARGGSWGSAIASFPLNGPSAGTHRIESSPSIPASATPASMVQAGGFVFVSVTLTGPVGGQVWVAPINSDGTFGAWKLLNATNGIAPAGDVMLGAFSDGSGSYLVEFGTGTATRGAKVNSDGTIGTANTWITGGALATARLFCGVYFASSGLNDGNGTLWLIGGWDGAATKLTIESAPITLGTGNIGAWTVAATGLPAATSNPFVALINAELYCIGGSATTVGATALSTTVYRILPSALGGAWTTDAGALSRAMAGFAYGQAVPGGGTGGATDQGAPCALLMGHVGSNNPMRLWFSPAAGGAVAGAEDIPGNAALLAANIGAVGGTLTAIADGSFDITYLWQAAPIGAAVLADGDLVTVYVQTTDQNGDPSAVSVSVFKVGQPPTLTNVLPGAAIATGRPTASFGFAPGPGSGQQQPWRRR